MYDETKETEKTTEKTTTEQKPVDLRTTTTTEQPATIKTTEQPATIKTEVDEKLEPRR